MKDNEYIKEDDRKRYVKPLEPGHPNYDRRKQQSWLKILGRGLPKDSPNYNFWYLDWAWKRMNEEKLQPETLKYLKNVLALKWKEMDNHFTRKAAKKDDNPSNS